MGLEEPSPVVGARARCNADGAGWQVGDEGVQLAPAAAAAEYRGLCACSLCSQEAHAFRLGIGCFVRVACRDAQTDSGLDAVDRVDVECRSVNRLVAYPSKSDGEVQVCCSCLRAGRAAITKDTEFSMVSWGQAEIGVTQGVPGLKTHWFPLVHNADRWYGAVIPLPECGLGVLTTVVRRTKMLS